MFDPRLALASLSGRADSVWAQAGAPHAGAAFLGGIALDEASRTAAEKLVEQDREEFLPPDPFTFIQTQLVALDDVPIRPGWNVRATDADPVRRAADICARHGAFLEVNAHCRQDELCAVGCGETLLADTGRLVEYVTAGVDGGATVGVKVRAEVEGVDLVETCQAIERAGAAFVHVDAMDDEPIVATITDETDLFVIANNEVRDRQSVREYLRYGADAVSVGRPSDEPVVLARVQSAVEAWFESESVAATE